MKYFIFQGNDHDCGFACLKMLLANLSKDKSYLYLKKKKKTEYFTFDDIIEIAKKYNVELSSYKCDESYYDQLKGNTIALVKENHTVFLKKVTKKYVVIYDPDFGIQKLSRNEFLSIWKHYIIEVDNAENVVKIPKIRRSILPKKLRIFEAISSVVSVSVLAGIFFLLNDEENTIFSLLFLLVFVVSQIVENIVIHKEINFFDKQYINRYFSRPKNQHRFRYLDFINFKRDFFSNSRRIIASSLIAALITGLLILNDFRNVFVILCMILIKTLEVYFSSKSMTKAKIEIGENEEKAFKNKSLCAEYVLKANSLANLKGSQESLKSVFYIAIAFAFSIAMMFLTSSSGCNFVIFHFGLYYVAFTSYSEILNYLSLRKEKEKQECRFFDDCNL